MTDITESDIEQLLKDPHFNESVIQFFSQKFHWSEVKAKTDQFKQQILQNQKDAQEYRKVEKILMNHCGENGENEGLIETLERIIKNQHYAECKTAIRMIDDLEKQTIKLQSQHKKLVDAIQKRTQELTLAKLELHPANNQHLIWTKNIDELQNLLKESEK